LTCIALSIYRMHVSLYRVMLTDTGIVISPLSPSKSQWSCWVTKMCAYWNSCNLTKINVDGQSYIAHRGHSNLQTRIIPIMTFILLPWGASTKKCLHKSILHKQDGLEAEIVLSCSLFLKPYYAMWYSLVNIVVCIVFDSNWMTCSQLCQSASNSRIILSFYAQK
jgi:hypothetical protein